MKTIFSAKCSSFKILSAGLMSLALIPSAAQAAYFLQLDGIKGESTDKDHKDWINFNSFSWGVTNSAPVGGGGGGSGKAVFQDFSWYQGLDRSITGLFSSVATGKHIKTAVVDFQSSGEKPIVYFKMSFNDVLLSEVSLQGSGGNKPFVDASFSYAKVTLDYWDQKPDGSRGTKSTASYDLKQGKGSVSALAGIYALGLIGPESVASVPEPETYAMLMAGLGLMGLIARRRQRVGKA
ncbi:MAG: type VI secretion system tube protein Hcp [Propionivibrio sp.]|uniref:Type VI secretion system tube protein Hcp n=1 Tax=Candidatus Propionivibrio dominans TaxID=2954373 RepID=A0A9D7IH68_9RHOO|nr:type VI secretion system tube protein Hcp [Candidatus Propionivibrio dominans]